MADQPPTPKGKRIMDTDVLVMGGLTILMAVWAFTRGADLPLRGLQAGLRLLQDVWLPLLFGFCLAGLFEVLVPRELLVRWMGKESGMQGILFGWLVGLLMPGGPYVVFPVAASLLKEGMGVGPLLTFITAKSLLSPIRLFTWEVPFLGWAFVTARTVPSLLLPPIIGIIGQRLYALFLR
ncbi:MAG: permease [candidate division NC10 bacterium]|nr:permease [candidate division NC10 bacterium]MDE2320865.1 permease [candidate division NC10 bacterium]